MEKFIQEWGDHATTLSGKVLDLTSEYAKFLYEEGVPLGDSFNIISNSLGSCLVYIIHTAADLSLTKKEKERRLRGMLKSSMEACIDAGSQYIKTYKDEKKGEK